MRTLRSTVCIHIPLKTEIESKHMQTALIEIRAVSYCVRYVCFSLFVWLYDFNIWIVKFWKEEKKSHRSVFKMLTSYCCISRTLLFFSVTFLLLLQWYMFNCWHFFEATMHFSTCRCCVQHHTHYGYEWDWDQVSGLNHHSRCACVRECDDDVRAW